MKAHVSSNFEERCEAYIFFSNFTIYVSVHVEMYAYMCTFYVIIYIQNLYVYLSI